MKRRKRRRREIFIAIIFLISAIGLFSTAGWVHVKNKEQNEVLKSIQEKASILEASKEMLGIQLEEAKEKNQQLTKQMQELNAEVTLLKSQGIDVERLLNEDESDKKYAYLTFDDGPSQNTIKILDFLKLNNISATFFVTKKTDYEEVYKRIVDEGHTLALHTTTHDYAQVYRSVDSFFEDLMTVSDYVKSLTGIESKIIRFPGGSNNTVSNRYGGVGLMDKIISQVKEKGYIYYDWNVDSTDASRARQDKNVIVDSVLSQAKYQKEANILMHDAAGKGTTVEALPEIVKGLREQGFSFKAITQETTPVQFK
ncbi:polysaccharide deacetylase family protein [Niameybacter massiliensis]|uniref:polysaccharide deacetylase family protein n=1 Tax=Niameybacter massiliensis TaxID=1658108 RepID=UPI0006B66123|nr:polysaccharide deacetylase family protein [Niameybacter massiliensis]